MLYAKISLLMCSVSAFRSTLDFVLNTLIALTFLRCSVDRMNSHLRFEDTCSMRIVHTALSVGICQLFCIMAAVWQLKLSWC